MSCRWRVLALLACAGSGLFGCSANFQLFVANDTSLPLALRINDFEHAYPLKASAKLKLPDRLQRGTAYTLVVTDRDGSESTHRIITNAGRLFVHLRREEGGRLQWLVSENPPQP